VAQHRGTLIQLCQARQRLVAQFLAALPGAAHAEQGRVGGFVPGLIGAGGFQCGGVYRSTNAGASWAAPSLSGVYVTDLAVDPTDATRVYACASFIAGILPPGGVWVSGDGGLSFSDTHLPATGALELAVSSTGNLVHAATPLGVYERGVRRTRVVPPR